MALKTDSYILGDKSVLTTIRVKCKQKKLQLPLRKRCTSIVNRIALIYSKCH